MRIRLGTVIAAALALMLASPPLFAQRGGRQTPAKPDTAKKPSASVSLDFQDQDLKVVLDALAAAGDLNVSMTNIPSQRITVHMGRPVDREGMIDVLKNVAEANGLKFTQTPTLIQISGTPAERGPTPQQILQQQLAQANQQQQVRLYTYRLRHASAVQLAPVLTNLFSGLTGGFTNTNGRGGTFTVPNANGGFTTIQTGPPGNIQTFPQQQNNPGRGGGAGRGGQANNQAGAEQAIVAGAPGGGRGGAIANAINSIFQATSGSLSNQANEIRIIAEETSNSLLVRATDSDWALVQQIIQGVDLRPLQVLIEVTIAEVTRTRSLDLGVSGVVKHTETGKDATNVTASAPSLASARDFILELTGGRGTINYDVALNALQARGDVKVLSLPVIIAQNNRQASLNVGSSRPFVQISQTVPNDPTGRVQTVQYIDVGTILTITPTINPDGYVNLQVTQTDNSATNEVQFDAPIINKREATTQVFIRDGQTTVIGGLAGNTKTRQDQGIPLISRIPLIGTLLFGNTSRTDDTTELFLFLTPHIISSDDDVDKLREAIREGSDLLRQMNIGPHIIPRADTIPVPPLRPPQDSTKKDSLTTMRRRPPQQ
ncbi:MAG TPA: secretin N-terminal domain-containing protein [Gemmatimonadaceae bacterium]|jgi:type II secretory pathway component GspD/PulD (secretin)|nr:secretin N-terminal domain-containing protein [Gemmatimonadaceae bacterium]